MSTDFEMALQNAEAPGHTQAQEFNFKSRLDILCAHAAQEGLKILPYTNDAWIKFRSMDHMQQDAALKNFSFFEDVCNSTLGDGRNLSDDITMLWHAVKKMGMRPRSDLFDKLAPTDIVEVYDHTFMQIFRNFNFFDICSYSLADIFMWEWRDLYKRDPQITAAIAEHGIQVLTGQVHDTVQIKAPEHVLEETFGPLGLKLLMQPKFFSPLYAKNGSVAATVVTTQVKVLESRTHPTHSTEEAQFYGHNGI